LFCGAAVLSGAAVYWFASGRHRSCWRCGKPQRPRPLRPPADRVPARRSPVKVAPVARRDVPIYLTASARCRPTHTVNVQSRIDGEIMQIAFEEGKDVKQGDVLSIIDQRPLQVCSWSSRSPSEERSALLDGAILDMKRYDTLVLKDFATRQQVDQQHALVVSVPRPGGQRRGADRLLPATSSTTPRSARRSAAASGFAGRPGKFHQGRRSPPPW